MRNFTLIFQFFIKDQTVKFQYIFVLVRDLNTGFTSVRNKLYNVYSAGDISKICDKRGWGRRERWGWWHETQRFKI